MTCGRREGGVVCGREIVRGPLTGAWVHAANPGIHHHYARPATGRQSTTLRGVGGPTSRGEGLPTSVQATRPIPA